MHKEQGNILILILIAVVLFAALSYAVTQSSRGSGNTDKETGTLEVSELLNYVTSVRSAINKMIVLGGSEESICFKSSKWGHVSYGAASTGCGSRPVLFDEFGGETYLMFPKEEWLDTSFSSSSEYGSFTFSGQLHVRGIGSDGSNDENAELSLIFPYVNERMCALINESLGLPHDPIPVEDTESTIGSALKRFGVAGERYMGSGSNVTIIGDDNPLLFGKDMGCANSGSRYYFWAVLLER